MLKLIFSFLAVCAPLMALDPFAMRPPILNSLGSAVAPAYNIVPSLTEPTFMFFNPSSGVNKWEAAKLDGAMSWDSGTNTLKMVPANMPTPDAADVRMDDMEAMWALVPVDSAAFHSETAFDSAGDAAGAQAYAIQRANHTGTQAWSTLVSTPTTIGGYGITDAATSAQGAKADTAVQPAALASYYLASNPAGYTTNTGTVTSVSAGTGLTGGPITTTGSLSLANVGTAGTYGLVTTNAQGQVTAGKRTETYSGTTNGSGVYTISFVTAYGAAPNIQANIINGTDTQNIRTTAISTTGFTVLVRNRTDVVGLLPSWSNVSGATVDVLITEK